MEMRREGAVFVLDLGPGENRVDHDLIAGLESALVEVESAPSPRALVTTASGKFYSYGFDLDLVRAMEVDEMGVFATRFERMLGHLLTAPFVTVAAIPGHCYAAGALLALAHDYRIMRQDRGWFCLPSIDVGIAFTRAMTELITSKVPAPTAQHLIISGDRMGGSACEGYGVVNDAVDGQIVLPRSIALAERLAAKDAVTLGTIKRRMHAAVTERIP